MSGKRLYKQDRSDVYNWLSRMTTTRPLMDNWLSKGDGNHVQELYSDADNSDTPGKFW
jgi:hypothetical protein